MAAIRQSRPNTARLREKAAVLMIIPVAMTASSAAAVPPTATSASAVLSTRPASLPEVSISLSRCHRRWHRSWVSGRPFSH